jgi:hypothetical protein
MQMLGFLKNVLCVGAGNVHVVPHHQLGGEAGAKGLQVRHVRKGKFKLFPADSHC